MLNWNTFSIAKTYNRKISFETSPSASHLVQNSRSIVGVVFRNVYIMAFHLRKHGGHFSSAWFARFPSQASLSTGPRHKRKHPQAISTTAKLYLPGRKVHEEPKRLACALARRFTLSQNGYGSRQTSVVI